MCFTKDALIGHVKLTTCHLLNGKPIELKRGWKIARTPFNTLVYPYRKVGDGEFEYALLKRADLGLWQGVSGGGEDYETSPEVAMREAFEETGVSPDSTFLQLDMIRPIPAIGFGVGHIGGEDVYVVPQYCFGVLVKDTKIFLSHEDTEFRWLTYEQAHGLLKYDGNMTALWELNQRLIRERASRIRK